jgi:hypothetical protein
MAESPAHLLKTAQWLERAIDFPFTGMINRCVTLGDIVGSILLDSGCCGGRAYSRDRDYHLAE